MAFVFIITTFVIIDSMSNLNTDNLERRLASVTLALLATIMLGLAIHTPLTVLASAHWPLIALYAKAWKEVLLMMAFILVIILGWRRHAWRFWLRDKLLWLIASFALWHLVLVALSLADGNSAATVVAGLVIDLRWGLMAATMYGFIYLYPHYRQILLKCMLAAAAMIIGFVCLQLILPRDFLTVFGYSQATVAPYMTVDSNDAYVRFGSTLRGPNPLGAYALGGLVLASTFLAAKWRDSVKLRAYGVLAAASSSIALYISYSRAAILGALAALSGLFAHQYGRKLPKKAWISIAAGVLIAAASGAYLLRDTSFMHNVILHDNPATGAARTSNDDHLSSLRDGVSKATRQPFGAGIGSTGSASLLGDSGVIIENQYLFIVHEAGWLGLVIYLMIVIIVLRRLWQQRNDWLALGVFLSGIGLSIASLFLPVFADDVIALVWWGLSALIMARPFDRKLVDSL